jgi:hypothetical protein
MAVTTLEVCPVRAFHAWAKDAVEPMAPLTPGRSQARVGERAGQGGRCLVRHPRHEQSTRRGLHRHPDHSPVTLFDGGPEVAVPVRLGAGGNATGDHRDDVGAEGIHPHEVLGAGQELGGTGMEGDSHAQVFPCRTAGVKRILAFASPSRRMVVLAGDRQPGQALPFATASPSRQGNSLRLGIGTLSTSRTMWWCSCPRRRSAEEVLFG